MTTPIIPEFVLKLFQDEVNKIVQCEIKRLCEIYKIDYEDAKDKLGLVELKTTPHPGFRLLKKNKKITDKDQRCMARMLHDLEVRQCSRQRGEECDLCGIHAKMKSKGRLKYGLMSDPLPDELRPEVLNEKKLTKIY